MEPSQAESLTDFLERLHLPLSSERLSAYRAAGDSDLDLIVTYFWNIALCEALYPALNAAEIALRNSIHAGISARYGTEDWFDDSGALEMNQRNDIQAARNRLIARGRPTNAGRVVAQLSFGFWVTLLSAPYEERIWKPHGFALLRAVFPHATRRQRRRGDLQKRFFAINRLRNRVFHYEPIWNYQRLERAHAEILEAVGWISPELHDSINQIDRFQEVYDHGRASIEADTKQRLGIS